MKYLAIDTSGKNLTVIAHVDGKTEIYFDAECGVAHSVKVMSAIEETALKVGLDFAQADFFACVVGAGSFTGIRIGVSTIKALCFAYKKPCLSITSFDTIAYNRETGKVLSVIDAKHNGYYVCAYQDRKIVIPPCFMTGEELSSIKEGYEILSFESLKAFENTIVSVSEGLKIAIENKKEEISLDLENLTPLYVRKSQAEEGRP